MKKLLIGVAAVTGVVFASTAANAWGVGHSHGHHGHHGYHGHKGHHVSHGACCAPASHIVQTGYNTTVQSRVVYEPRVQYRTVTTPTYARVVPHVSYSVHPIASTYGYASSYGYAPSYGYGYANTIGWGGH